MRHRNLRRLRAALASLPYPTAVRITRTLSGSAVMRRVFFPRTTRAVEDTYRRGCGIACDDRTVQLLVMSKLLSGAAAQEIGSSSGREFANLVRVNGLDILSELCASDRGLLIMGAHFITTSAIRPVMNGLDIRPYHIKRSGPGKAHDDLEISTYDKAPFFGLKEVQTILKKGGQVFLLGDGRQGTFAVTQSFFGRDCHFKAGIFELGVRLGAAVLPVSSYLEIDGRVVVDFHPPLQAGDPNRQGEPSTAGLVHAFADFVQSEIRARPWCFDPLRLELFLAGAEQAKEDAGRP